jgi:sugar phosphate isomerase/epimerase
MAQTAIRVPQPTPTQDGIGARLGLNVPAGWWPGAPALKSLEASGFSWVQIHAPPRTLICHPAGCERHALALRRDLDTTGLRLVLHAPDELSAGTPDMDLALDGLLDYARDAGAERIVYHAANFVDDGRAVDRLCAEERSLRVRCGRIEELGLGFALENLAPVYPGPPRLSHHPELVAGLVDRLDSAAFGMCFDAGHANIVGDAPLLLEPLLDRVVLFHLHDNHGARDGASAVPGVDPLKLDLHLPPGRGTVPWSRLAPLLEESVAPLLLEVHPPHRPRPEQLATVAGSLLRSAA